MADTEEIHTAILTLCQERGPQKSICPSEVARSLAANEPDWRALMPAVRRAARTLARQNRIEIVQKGRVLDPGAEISGPIRLRVQPD